VKRAADVRGLFTTDHPVWGRGSILTISGPDEDGKYGYRFHNTMGELTWEFKEYLTSRPIKSAVASHDKWREEFEMRNNQPVEAWVKVDDNTYRKPGTAWVAVYDGGDSYQPWRMTHDDFPASEWAMTYHMRGHKPKNLRTALAKLEEFLAQHKPPRPALPNEGDYIRVTYEDGATDPHQGTVVRVTPYGMKGAAAGLRLDTKPSRELFVIDRVKEQNYGMFGCDVTWEPAEKPEKEWAFGDIVTSVDKPTGEFRAVDKDGSLWFDTGAMYTQYAPYKLVWLADKEI